MPGRALCGLMLLGLLAPLTGCGPTGPVVAPVSGVVTLDGKPVAGAQVVFTPVGEGRPGMGSTNDQGEYQLTTTQPQDGAVVGEHKVVVILIKSSVQQSGIIQEGPAAVSGPISNESAPIEWLVPERYSRVDTSGLTAKVAPGPNSISLSLTTQP